MLTATEKEALYQVIRKVIGDDPTISGYKTQFNDRTVDVVEEMISQDAKCNENMKLLVQELLAGGKTVAKGWLKKLLSQGQKIVKKSGQWQGGACKNIVKSKWRTAIIDTAI